MYHVGKYGYEAGLKQLVGNKVTVEMDLMSSYDTQLGFKRGLLKYENQELLLTHREVIATRAVNLL